VSGAPRVNPAWWSAVWLALAPPAYGLLRMRVTGREHVPRTGALLVVANHVSQKDPPLIGVALAPRRLHFMAKHELFRVPLLGPFIARTGAFPVRRGGADRGAFRIAREILARGDALLMFPEGTRSPEGRLRRGWPGAGSLALEPGVTAVPVALWGSQRRLGRVRVVVGPPVDLSEIPPGARATRAQEATDRMMAAVAGLLPRAGGPAPGPAPRAEAPAAGPVSDG
jgi:1-acyl-sn-glycerol-3-phosphate acyltransferase